MSCPFELEHELSEFLFDGDVSAYVRTYTVFKDPSRIGRKGRERLVEEWLRSEQNRVADLHRRLLDEYVNTEFP